MEYREIIRRISVARIRAKLSARELSGRIGKNHNYISNLESKKFQLSVSTLLSILEVCEMSLEEFFYPNFEQFQEDYTFREFLRSLTKEQRGVVAAIAAIWPKRK